MIEKTYGHLGQARHRAEVVEYRVEQHAATLEDRLAAVRASAQSAVDLPLFARNERQTASAES